MTNIVWFRSDLRITDNPALSAALAGNRIKNVPATKPVFIISRQQWQMHGWGNKKTDFMLSCVEELREQLLSLNLELEIIECDLFREIPSLLLQYAQQNNCKAVYFNYEYELNERLRDEQVSKTLTENNIDVFKSHDQCLVPPGTVLTKQDTPYTVFTPFKKACYKVLLPQSFSLENKYEGPAQKRLHSFCNKKIGNYAIDRDFPSIDGTSQLSPYLAAGAISIRECYLAAKHNTETERALPWIDELLWRDFYRHIVYHFPDVCKGKNFNQKYDQLKWNKPGINLKRWQNGETGIPIIDAAMRQMVETGWMHNRLRMIVAMFLTKNLLIDWRHGEDFFAKHLIDLDFASNNGGWQWSASTGTDAAPYFRIFNPLTQSAKFDPDAIFIKKYCPELKRTPTKEIHNPDPSKIIVDLSKSRAMAIEAYKNI